MSTHPTTQTVLFTGIFEKPVVAKYLVPGTAPLIVLRDSRVEWLPPSLPPAAAIERFEARWTERQRE